MRNFLYNKKRVVTRFISCDYPLLPYSPTGGCQPFTVCYSFVSCTALSIPTAEAHTRHFITYCACAPSLYKNNLVRLLTLLSAASSNLAPHDGQHSFGIFTLPLCAFVFSRSNDKKRSALFSCFCSVIMLLPRLQSLIQTYFCDPMSGEVTAVHHAARTNRSL